MEWKSFHRLIKTNSPNVLYYATKELVLHKNKKNKNAICLACNNIVLMEALIEISEEPPSQDLWLEAAKNDSVELAQWLWGKRVPFTTFVFKCAALSHSIRFLQWGCATLTCWYTVVEASLISVCSTRLLFESLPLVQRQQFVYYIQTKGFLIYDKTNPMESILYLLRHVPRRVIRLQDNTTFSMLRIGALRCKKAFFTLLPLDKKEIHSLLLQQNLRHPGIKQLHYLLDGNTIEIEPQPIFIKRYVFDIVMSFLLDSICANGTIILDYLGLDFPPRWLLENFSRI